MLRRIVGVASVIGVVASVLAGCRRSDAPLFQGPVDVLVDEEVFVLVSATPYSPMNAQLEDPTFASVLRVARRGQ